MLCKDFLCSVAFATLASAAVAKQVPNTNWDKYANARHHDSHHDSHGRVHAREAEADASYNGAWHADGAHGGAHPAHKWDAPHNAHHARDAMPEAATATKTHVRPSQSAWTKPAEWASWWANHPRPTPVHRGREHQARDAEPEAEPGFIADKWDELKQKFGARPNNDAKPNHGGKPINGFKPNNGFGKVHAREAEAEPGFKSGGAKPQNDIHYDINADWHKKLLAGHGVNHNHARDVEDEPLGDDVDMSEEGYGEGFDEPLQARDVEGDESAEETYISDEFIEKLYARDVPQEEQGNEDGIISDEFLKHIYARDVVDEGEEYTAEEAEEAYHDYLQRRGLDASHVDGPSAEEDEPFVDEEYSDLNARAIDGVDFQFDPELLDDLLDGVSLEARDARNAFVAGNGAHPEQNSAKANSEAHRRIVAAQLAKLSARDAEEATEIEADEPVAEFRAPPAEQDEDAEIQARGLPIGLPKGLPTVSFIRPNHAHPTQTGRSGFGGLFGKAW